MIKNILTVDVEDWFQVETFKDKIDRCQWDECECRITYNLYRILEILDETQTKATFFILGWIAERYPELVLEIDRNGHEVASHGYEHQVVYEQGESEFRNDIEKSLSVLERITSKKVKGYRAPNFSITKRSLWAYDILEESGIRYTSSIFPAKHIFQVYGMNQAPRFPFELLLKNGHCIKEFPLSTVVIFGKQMPLGGGAYLRIMPYWYNKWAIKKINQQGHPAIVYFHPWEIDPHQPRQELHTMARFRHYFNLDIMELKIRSLLKDFIFCPVREFL